jgi:hypothetical protein
MLHENFDPRPIESTLFGKVHLEILRRRSLLKPSTSRPSRSLEHLAWGRPAGTQFNRRDEIVPIPNSAPPDEQITRPLVPLGLDSVEDEPESLGEAVDRIEMEQPDAEAEIDVDSLEQEDIDPDLDIESEVADVSE